MNFICLKENLEAGIQAASFVAKDNESLPVLKHALIEIQDGKILLTATNLETGLKYFLSGKAIESGSLTVPVQPLLQIIHNLQYDRVTLSSKNNTLEISTENYHAKFQGGPKEEFPLFPKRSGSETRIEVPEDILKNTLERVTAASQVSELRPELNSVRIHYGLGVLTFAATDSFRLAEKKLSEGDFSAGESEEFTLLLPLKTAQQLGRILEDKKEKVEMIKNANQVWFISPRFEFVSRTLEGTFPDYQAIIPKKLDAEVVMDKEELVNAVKLVNSFGGGIQEIILRPGAHKKTLDVFSRHEHLGENTCSVAAKIDGEFQEVSFNAKYFLDGLRSISGKNISFGAQHENKPAILRSEDDSLYFYIVMPILKR